MVELWIALVLTWHPTVLRVVDKEFNSEKECWDYYEVEIAPETTVGEGKWGRQVLTAQNTRPDKNYFFKTNNNYPIRVYRGLNYQNTKRGHDQVWLSCEPKYARIYNE